MRSISKLMVGVAVAGACGYTSAATITSTGLPNAGTNYSRQGAILNANTNLAGNATVVLADTYVQFDTLRLGIVNGTFASADASHTASFVCSANGVGGVGSIVFTYTQASSLPAAAPTVLVYTAANPGAGTTSTSGLSCAIPTIFVRSDSMTTAGNVQIDSRSVKAGGSTYDLGAAVTIATVQDQFAISTTVTPLNGVVETNGGRLSFTTASADTFNGWNADNLSVVLTNRGLNNSVSAGSMVLTLTASSSLAFLQEPDGVTGVAGGSCTATSGTGVAGVTVAGTAGTISFPSAGNSGTCAVLIASVNTVVNGTYTLGLGRNGAATSTNSTAFTAPQSFTVAATAGSGTLTLASLASTAAGSWSLSGTTADLAYVPLSSSVNLQLFVANTSNQSGTVTFTAWNDSSNSTCTGTLGPVSPGSTASFGSALKTALQACTGAGWSTATRAAVQILSTTPSASTEIHSAFSASDSVSRQLIINSTNSN